MDWCLPNEQRTQNMAPPLSGVNVVLVMAYGSLVSEFKGKITGYLSGNYLVMTLVACNN